MKTEFIKSKERKTEQLLKSKGLQKYDIKRSFSKLVDMPFSSYKEMKKAISNKKTSIIINFLNSDNTIFNLIASKNEKIIYLFSLFATYIITFLMIGLAIYLGNYFLLIAILWFFLASNFSSYYFNPPLYPFKGRRIADIMLIICILTLILSDTYTIPLLAFSYVLIHWSYALNRRVYKFTLYKRAMESEILFRLLYIGKYIKLS